MKRRFPRWLVGCILAALLASAASFCLAGERELAAALVALKAVGPKGAGHKQAVAAWPVVAEASPQQLTTVLAAMEGANPLAENWLRSAAETIAQRAIANQQLPQAALEDFLRDTKRSPRARRLAYELVANVDATAKERLIPGLLNDPSLELRRDAVALAIAQAEAALAQEEKRAAIAGYRQAFRSARDLDQIKETAKKLRSLGEQVDLPRHFGFITSWQVIGPFANKGADDFAYAYPPESFGFLANAEYEGSTGPVTWVEASTADDFGTLDLNAALGKHKGAIAYAYADFVSDRAQTVQFRLGSANANKLWVNGQEVFSNYVYHSGLEVDQYVGTARLKKGHNTILVKIAQNEQTDSWAQIWQFQLRVCDEIGTAVLSADQSAP